MTTYGRQSLALDLVEPFRAPLVDRLVLTVLNRRQFNAADFERAEGGGLYLDPSAARRFLGEYERWMLHEPAHAGGKAFRAALRDQVHSYARAIGESNPDAYQPYVYEVKSEIEEAACNTGSATT